MCSPCVAAIQQCVGSKDIVDSHFLSSPTARGLSALEPCDEQELQLASQSFGRYLCRVRGCQLWRAEVRVCELADNVECVVVGGDDRRCLCILSNSSY